MLKETLRYAWVEINLNNLNYNIQQIKKNLNGNAELIAVIKADAYGHGSIKVAEVLRQNEVKRFAVASLSEAIHLRKHGIDNDIIVLGITPEVYAETVVKYNISPVICSYEDAKEYSKEAVRKKKILSIYIAVDTGMGRIGYIPEEKNSIFEMKKIKNLNGIVIEGVISHFATADSHDKTYSLLQKNRFDLFINKLKDEGIDIPTKAIANSAAIMEMAETYYDAVRAGIILYGCYPSNDVDKSKLDLKPVMSVKAKIVHLKNVIAGTSVSYGRRFITKRDSKIATLTLGYADGFPRLYSMTGKTLLNGCFAPIAGNICMDQCMIDVTDIPDVKLGDEVIIMGSDGCNSILADDIAKETHTINYEILCAFGQRLPKVYVG